MRARSYPGVIVVLVALLTAAGCRTAPRDVGPPIFAEAVVAADHPVASEAGASMLRRGGNAVDAAVAASFCLSVVRPYSCGIGGGGFMIVHRGGDAAPVAVNYRETAPAAVGPDYYETSDAGDDPLASRLGVRAAGVPGTVAGLLFALEHYGTLDRATVLAPAIRAATDGFEADAHFVGAMATVRSRLDERPGAASDAASDAAPGADYIWRQLCHEGALQVGDIVTNPQQAEALELIARDGAAAFYRGPIADAIVAAMQAGGGAITHADLYAYRPEVVAPLRGRFGGYEVLAMPPPSSGGIAMLQIMGILERRGVGPALRAEGGPTRPRSVHLVVEAMKHAFADRARWLADEVFVPVPTRGLLAPAYLDERARAIDPASTKAPEAYGTMEAPPDDAGTSHISVLDAQGMAVACTETINTVYGALVTVPGYGFALNNEMDDFTTRRGAANAYGLLQSDRNRPEPGKRPLSSMSPTIVLRDGRAVLIAGASGGPRIITGTLQVVMNCLVFGMPAHEAVAAPRFHHQWMPDVLQFEDAWTDAPTIDALASYGHATGRRKEVGIVQVIQVTLDGIRAASDPRKGGVPAGY